MQGFAAYRRRLPSLFQSNWKASSSTSQVALIATVVHQGVLEIACVVFQFDQNVHVQLFDLLAFLFRNTDSCPLFSPTCSERKQVSDTRVLGERVSCTRLMGTGRPTLRLAFVPVCWVPCPTYLSRPLDLCLVGGRDAVCVPYVVLAHVGPVSRRRMV